MTDLYRHKAIWTGFSGAPGVSTFYGLGSSAMTPAIRALFSGLGTYMSNLVQIQVENTGDIIDDVTGDLTGAWSNSAVAITGGTNSGAFSAPTGFEAQWLTSTILDGHRLKGRTFFVPSSGSTFDTNGTITSVNLAGITAAVTTFLGAVSGDLVVWHRPRAAAAATPYHPEITARAGGHGVVVASNVPDKAVVLRSRRD